MIQQRYFLKNCDRPKKTDETKSVINLTYLKGKTVIFSRKNHWEKYQSKVIVFKIKM